MDSTNIHGPQILPPVYLKRGMTFAQLLPSWPICETSEGGHGKWIHCGQSPNLIQIMSTSAKLAQLTSKICEYAGARAN